MRSAPGPTETRLEALWHRWHPWRRRLAPHHVLREVRLRARFDLSVPDPARIRRAIPPGRVPDCTHCPDRCCGGWDNLVSLRLSDVARLLDLDRAHLISRRKPRLPAERLAARPSLQALNQSMLWRVLPVLKQVGPARTCAALTEQGRCSLHPAWPASCARFPYTLDVSRARVHWGSRCPIAQPKPNLAHADALFTSALRAYEEKLKDAILLTHARQALDDMGIGSWLCSKDEDPFE